MLTFWFEIPSIFRGLFALAVLGVGIVSIFTGYRAYEQVDEDQARTGLRDLAGSTKARGSFEVGFVMTILGVGLLAASGRSSSEKKGYRSI